MLAWFVMAFVVEPGKPPFVGAHVVDDKPDLHVRDAQTMCGRKCPERCVSIRDYGPTEGYVQACIECLFVASADFEREALWAKS